MTHVSPTIEPVYELFGARLRQARLRKGITVPELARKLTDKRSVSSVAQIEAGQTRFPLHVAAELAAAVGMSLTDMIRPSRKRAKWDALGQ